MRRALIAACVLIASVAALDHALPPDLGRYRARALLVEDHAGRPVDLEVSRDGMIRLGATADDVDPRYLRLLLATEDARFRWHPGVDPLALARAAFQLATRGRIVSGGSTLTMQVARLLEPHRRSVIGKLHDVARALQLELRFGKQRILAMYLTLAPMGGNIEGVRAAALAWFGHGPEHLTAAEAALLVALPRSPTRLRPDRHPAPALAAAARVLARAGWAPDPLGPPVHHALPRDAFHLAERLRGSGVSDAARTTLDADLQRGVSALAAREQPWIGTRANIAALVVRNSDRAVLAYLGGADRTAAGGMVDMVRAVRSPGSTLKPFVYGMGFDAAVLRPDTLIADSRARIGDYAPHDFDRQFHGEVTAGEALRQSYNLPAIEVLDRVGPATFTAALGQVGARLSLPGGAPATLPIVLGGAGITLGDLTMLYAGLAHSGEVGRLRLLAADPLGPARPLMSAQAARDIGRILRATPRPDGVLPGRARAVAYKTGTSFGFRDAWAAGFSRAYTVVVWVGRTDGTPRPGSYGANTAAPLLFKMFDLLPPEPADAAGPPMRPRAPPARAPSLVRLDQAPGPSVVFPPPGATLEPFAAGAAATPVGLEATGGAPPYRWTADGLPLPEPADGAGAVWTPDGAGFAHLSVTDRLGRAASVNVRVR